MVQGRTCLASAAARARATSNRREFPPSPPAPSPPGTLVPFKERMVGTRSLMHMASDGEEKAAIRNRLFQSGTLLDGLETRSCQRRV